MLTRRGLGVVIAGVVLYAAGVALGYIQLIVLGAGALLPIVLGLGWILRRPRLDVQRRIDPDRVSRGDAAFGTLNLVNPGPFLSAPVLATEPCGPTSVLIEIPRLRAGAATTKRYRLPTDRRGVLGIGPLQVTRSDPLGLWRTNRQAGTVQRLWVYPVVYPLVKLPVGRTRSLEGRPSETMPRGSVTFHSLREYVVGDDLRMVHWRSTARTGTLMVRESVDTSMPQLTVIVDTRWSVHEAQTFESVVEAAASVVRAATDTGYPVRLLTTGGRAIGGRGFTADARGFLDFLAELHLEDDHDLRRVLRALATERRSDALVFVTGSAKSADIAVMGALAKRYDDAVIGIVCRLPDDVVVPRSVPAVILRAQSGEAFARHWNRVMA